MAVRAISPQVKSELVGFSGSAIKSPMKISNGCDTSVSLTADYGYYSSGFLTGELIIPNPVLVELRHIADSEDQLKRNRGRRGLDVLNIIQREINFPVTIDSEESNGNNEVDSEILLTAQRHNARILTTDYNLNKVASVRNISVMNINDLANAMKPIALPGEKLGVQVVKDGKEEGQGIGYMDDAPWWSLRGKTHMGEMLWLQACFQTLRQDDIAKHKCSARQYHMSKTDDDKRLYKRILVAAGSGSRTGKESQAVYTHRPNAHAFQDN